MKVVPALAWAPPLAWLHPPGLDQLSLLVDKSLVTMQEATSGEARYHLLETVRQYAQRRLQESGVHVEVCFHHTMYYLHLSEEAEKHLAGPQQVDWLSRAFLDPTNGSVGTGCTGPLQAVQP